MTVAFPLTVQPSGVILVAPGLWWCHRCGFLDLVDGTDYCTDTAACWRRVIDAACATD
jgi:hypothetical protein